MKYDFLIVGAGPFGATFARTVTDAGKRCLVIDRREHLAGNTFTEKIEGIDVHIYGPHMFHTDSEQIWNFVNSFGKWNTFRYTPRVRYGDRMFSFPINLLTLHQLWGVSTPEEARQKLNEVRIPCDHPANAEQWLLSQVGREIYEIFFRGYTTKQWFKDPSQLPAAIVARLPIRLTYNDGYFRDQFQAIPRDGYTSIFSNMLDGIDVEIGTDFYPLMDSWPRIAKQLVFTGPIDQFFGYEFGQLEYRANRFEMEVLEGDFQGHPVINYPALDVEFTRITEHKHFADAGPKHIKEAKISKTVITRDIPIPPGSEEILKDPHYPIRDARNSRMFEKYQQLSKSHPRVLFGGRLGEYRYYDMDQVIGSAIAKANRVLSDQRVPKAPPMARSA
ncbi:MAG: UDP-galactopyranose mutase [Planctomycetota bacterium]|nr:UDP-galactopyranose mutase [Planctomycetota bacterium]